MREGICGRIISFLPLIAVAVVVVGEKYAFGGGFCFRWDCSRLNGKEDEEEEVDRDGMGTMTRILSCRLIGNQCSSSSFQR